MGFYPPAENLCVMMRENIKTKSSEYIVNYQDDLYIASTAPEEILNILQDKCQININPDSYIEGKDPHDPAGTMTCQFRKYVEKLYVNVTVVFNDKLLKDIMFNLKSMKLLITEGNLNLIHNQTTYEHLNQFSKKRKLSKLYNEMKPLILSKRSQLTVEYLR